MKTKEQTQIEDILGALQEGRSITSLDALNEFGCMRLAAVVFCLREEGYNITTDMISAEDRHGRTSRIARYTLVK